MKNKLKLHNLVPNDIKSHFVNFSNNGVWGTCGKCKMIAGFLRPELCENHNRTDHQLSLDSLVEIYKHCIKINEVEINERI